MKNEKLTYLDGIKTFAAILIFNTHFLNVYYPGIYTLNPADFHTQNLEWIFGATPLNIVYAGKFGVHTFMMLSGFLAARRYCIKRDKEGLTESAIKKYFRLVCPIAAVNILIVIFMLLGLYRNNEAAALAGSMELFGNYNTFVPNIFAALKEAVWGCFVTGANTYNGPLWFIYYEFFGTLLVGAMLALFGNVKSRYIIYAIACVILIRTDFLVFLLGMVLADVVYTKPEFTKKITKHQWLMWLILLAALFLGTYPSRGMGLEGSIYEYIPPKVMLYYNVAAPAMLFAIMHLEPLKRLLSAKIFTAFNKVSYSFYLIHFSILCTFSSSLFLALHEKMNYHLLAVMNYLFAFIVSLVFAWMLTKIVDKPSMKIMERISAKLLYRES